MLTITVPVSEDFDESTGRFITRGYDLDLEHSLDSLSKWEQHFEKPFLSREEKTHEETMFYIGSCMLQTKNPPGDFLQKLSKKNFDDIQAYIESKQTATTIKQTPGGARPIITNEVVLGWMAGLGISYEMRYVHLNKLFMLINVINEQKKPQKKMNRGEAARQQHALNAQRQAQMGTRG